MYVVIGSRFMQCKEDPVVLPKLQAHISFTLRNSVHMVSMRGSIWMRCSCDEKIGKHLLMYPLLPLCLLVLVLVLVSKAFQGINVRSRPCRLRHDYLSKEGSIILEPSFTDGGPTLVRTLSDLIQV